MAHAHLKEIDAETHRASWLLIGTLTGGMLVLSSFLVGFPAVAKTLFQFEPALGPDGRTHNPYSDVLALAGALMLGVPLVWHAIKCLAEGRNHMDELVALGELRGYLSALVEMTYQSTGGRRIKNPRIWSMHDISVLAGGRG